MGDSGSNSDRSARDLEASERMQQHAMVTGDAPRWTIYASRSRSMHQFCC
jgi:hypothetical protein